MHDTHVIGTIQTTEAISSKKTSKWSSNDNNIQKKTKIKSLFLFLKKKRFGLLEANLQDLQFRTASYYFFQKLNADRESVNSKKV